MKKILSICLLLHCVVGIAQEQFKGKITYEYAYDNVPLDMTMKMMMSTDKEIVNYADSAWCMEQISKAGTRKMFNHFGSDSVHVYASYFTFKAHLVFALNDTADKEKPVVEEIKYFEKSKKIAGIECKLATIKFKDQEKPLPVYYAPNIPNINRRDFPGLKGLPMMFVTKWKEIDVVKKAVSVTPLDAAWDARPKGYKRMSTEELKGKFGSF